jgi:hypothetical protein
MNKHIHIPRVYGILALVGLFCLGLASCSATSYKLEIVTEPQGASVYVNGELVGAGPKVVSMPFDKSDRVWVQVSFSGYEHQDTNYTLEEVEGQSQIVIKLRKQ